MNLYFLKAFDIKISVSLPKPDSSLGTKRSRKERGWASMGGGSQPPFCLQPKERCFAEFAEVQREWLTALDSMPSKIKQCFRYWERRWDRCTQSQDCAMQGTKVSNLYEYFKQISFNNSRNLWVPPCTQGSSLTWRRACRRENDIKTDLTEIRCQRVICNAGQCDVARVVFVQLSICLA